MSPVRRMALSTSILVAVAGCSGSASDSSAPFTTTAATTAGTSGAPATASVDGPPESTAPTVAGTGKGLPEGFTTVTAQITEPDGTVCQVCVWLADSPEERSRGLMRVTDLGDAAGMVFAFDEPLVGTFYMFDTPTPLSIAWFLAGSLVGTTDMVPCLDTPANECPRYTPDTAYDLALEVFEGGLDAVGIRNGSSLELVPGTEGTGCPTVSPPTP